MEKEYYEKKIAQLESLNDQLQAEFTTLDRILKELGFEKGIITLKDAATEMLNNKNENDEVKDSPIDDIEF
jgi:hypothetical protein